MSSQINVFISYCHKDKDIKLRLEKLLTDRGLNVLSDSMIQAGEDLHREISKLLNQSHFVVPIISQHWLNSIETRDEFVRAHERRKLMLSLIDSESIADANTLPFFIMEHLRLHYTKDTVNDKLEQVYSEIRNRNFIDFWKNKCYDEIRRLGDLIQNNNNLHNYKSSQFEKKLSKLHSDLSNILNDLYETNVSYEDNFLKDASPYFEYASKIHAVSMVDVSTFWTDRKAQNAALSYLQTQSHPEKDVIRLFVFETPRQVHYFKKILLRNFNYYVQSKVNNSNLLSGVLICSRRTYQKLLLEEMEYQPISANKIFEQDFGILTYESQLNKHSLEATLDSTNFKVKKIKLEDELTRNKFVQFLNDIVRYKDDNYCLQKYNIAKLTGHIFEDNQKWNSMVDSLFSGQSTGDIFHVVHFNIKPSALKSFEDTIGKFFIAIETKKKDGELKFESASLKKFKKISNARDHISNGDLTIQKNYNYSLTIRFKSQEDLEKYYHDSHHGSTREKVYSFLNPETKKLYARIKQRGISDSEKQKLFGEIEGLVSESIVRADWEQFDIKDTIIPHPF